MKCFLLILISMFAGLAPANAAQSQEFEHRWAGLVFDAFQSDDGTLLWTVEDGGRIRRRNASGVWSYASVPDVVKDQLHRVHMLAPTYQVGWSVGQDGWILKTTDGGATWTALFQKLNLSATGTEHLFDIHFLDNNTGWLVGAHGVWYTINGGATEFDWIEAPVYVGSTQQDLSLPHVELYAVDVVERGTNKLALLSGQPGVVLRSRNPQATEFEVVWNVFNNLCGTSGLTACQTAFCQTGGGQSGVWYEAWDIEMSRNSTPLALMVGGVGGREATTCVPSFGYDCRGSPPSVLCAPLPIARKMRSQVLVMKRSLSALLIVGWLLGVPALTNAQVQRIKLVAPDADTEDWFGTSVAIDGDWVLVGSPLDDDGAFQSGAVYAFRKVNGAWTFTQKLKANDIGDSAEFGDALAMDGAIAVIGAHMDSPMGVHSAGSAYVFERVGDTWTQRAKLSASDAAPNWNFGNDVAVSGSAVVVGSAHASGVSWGSGAAYVFEGSGNNWPQVARLVPNDGGQGDSFGSAVAIDGNLIVVGAAYADLTTSADQGAAYAYERVSPNTWLESQKLTSLTPVASDYFGFDVALEGDSLLIGAAAANTVASNSGAVFVFKRYSNTWRRAQTLTAHDTVAADQFGTWVALDGHAALTSAHLTDDMSSSSGGAYHFVYQGTSWTQKGKLLPQDNYDSHLVGMALDVSGGTAILGCPFDNALCPQVPSCSSGAAYIFDLAVDATQYGSCPSNSPCNNADAHGGCRNATGHGAVLQACGTGSVQADDLFLELRQLPPNAFHILFMGAAMPGVVFGNGLRVVGGGTSGVFRFPVQAANAQGVATRGPGIVAQTQSFNPLGRISAGQTWSFQGWYRDTAGPCGTGFNLTNGLRVNFTP